MACAIYFDYDCTVVRHLARAPLYTVHFFNLCVTTDSGHQRKQFFFKCSEALVTFINSCRTGNGQKEKGGGAYSNGLKVGSRIPGNVEDVYGPLALRLYRALPPNNSESTVLNAKLSN